MTDTTVEFCKIVPALQHLRAPVGQFQRHPDNARVGDVKKIAESLAAFGQMKPIVVQQSTGLIVAGNHTFEAAVTELKWSHIAASVVELDDQTALRYLIADNATSDLAEYDKVRRAKTLTRLAAEGGQMAFVGTGVEASQDDIDTWAALASGAEIEPEKPFKGDYASGPEPAVEDKPRPGGDPEKPPMREVVLLLEIEDAQLLAARVKNLQKKYPDGGGLTATILRSVATAHEHFYGSADPGVAGAASVPETEPETPEAA